MRNRRYQDEYTHASFDINLFIKITTGQRRKWSEKTMFPYYVIPFVLSSFFLLNSFNLGKQKIVINFIRTHSAITY